jgi:hypothetical protein
MTTDEHREKAERLLVEAEKGGPTAYVASLERRAIAHAALSISRTEPPARPATPRRNAAKKPGPKKSTTTKENGS